MKSPQTKSKKRKPNTAPPKKSGPKPTPIDIALVGQLASIQCTYDEIAAVIKLGKRAFIDRINADPELRKAIDDGWANGRASIRRQQFKLLESGNATMGIWLGKQYLGQRDNLDTKLTGSGPNGEIEISDGDPRERILSRISQTASSASEGGSDSKPEPQAG